MFSLGGTGFVYAGNADPVYCARHCRGRNAVRSEAARRSDATSFVHRFVFLALFGAYLLKRSNTMPTVSAPIPLYKLFAIDEYGYKGVFNDLLAYALPFLAAGIFLRPLFPDAACSPRCSPACFPLCF